MFHHGAYNQNSSASSPVAFFAGANVGMNLAGHWGERFLSCPPKHGWLDSARHNIWKKSAMQRYN
jgi:hypothetical protein